MWTLYSVKLLFFSSRHERPHSLSLPQMCLQGEGSCFLIQNRSTVAATPKDLAFWNHETRSSIPLISLLLMSWDSLSKLHSFVRFSFLVCGCNKYMLEVAYIFRILLLFQQVFYPFFQRTRGVLVPLATRRASQNPTRCLVKQFSWGICVLLACRQTFSKLYFTYYTCGIYLSKSTVEF